MLLGEVAIILFARAERVGAAETVSIGLNPLFLDSDTRLLPLLKDLSPRNWDDLFNLSSGGPIKRLPRCCYRDNSTPRGYSTTVTCSIRTKTDRADARRGVGEGTCDRHCRIVERRGGREPIGGCDVEPDQPGHGRSLKTDAAEAYRFHCGASHHHQSPDRRDAERRPALPPVGKSARPPSQPQHRPAWEEDGRVVGGATAKG